MAQKFKAVVEVVTSDGTHMLGLSRIHLPNVIDEAKAQAISALGGSKLLELTIYITPETSDA